MVTVEKRDDILDHTTVTGVVVVAVVAESLRHYENTTMKRTSKQHEAQDTSIGIHSSKEVTQNDGEQLL